MNVDDLAPHAPAGLEPDEIFRSWRDLEYWYHRTCKVVTIRSAPSQGYVAWLGSGLSADPIGPPLSSYEEARDAGLAAMMDRRAAFIADVEAAGWGPDTPEIGREAIEREPIIVRRAPAIGRAVVVEVWREGRCVERLDYDDTREEEARRAWLAANAAGQAAARSRAEAAVRAFAGIVPGKGETLERTDLWIDGARIRILGPVRMRDGQPQALALDEQGERVWVTPEQIAGST